MIAVLRGKASCRRRFTHSSINIFINLSVPYFWKIDCHFLPGVRQQITCMALFLFGSFLWLSTFPFASTKLMDFSFVLQERAFAGLKCLRNLRQKNHTWPEHSLSTAKHRKESLAESWRFWPSVGLLLRDEWISINLVHGRRRRHCDSERENVNKLINQVVNYELLIALWLWRKI